MAITNDLIILPSIEPTLIGSYTFAYFDQEVDDDIDGLEDVLLSLIFRWNIHFVQQKVHTNYSKYL